MAISFDYTGRCRVRQATHGDTVSIPAGFRVGQAYNIITGLLPNGTSDIHYVVINESGQTVTLRHDAIDILKGDDELHSLGGSRTHVVKIPFTETPLRNWSAHTPELEKPVSVVCYDEDGNQIAPHKVVIDETTRSLNVFWSMPIKGTMCLIITDS